MILFLYGEDIYRSRLKLHQIRDEFAKKHGADNIASFDFDENEISTLQDMIGFLHEPSFLAQAQMALSFDLMANLSKMGVKWQKRLDDLLDDMISDKYFWFVIWESLPTKKILKEAHAKKALKNSKVNITEYKKPSSKELSDYGLQYLHESNIVADDKVMTDIASQSPDSAFFYTSLDTLIASAGNSRNINQEDLKILRFPHKFDNIFDVIDAINNRQRAQLYLILKKHYHLFKAEPLGLLGLVVSQIRKMLIIDDFNKKNISPNEIARKTKMKSFPIQKMLSGCKNYPNNDLKTIYGDLSLLDLRVKTGEILPDELLDLIPLTF